jgi:NDP-sugar pyrophosphorylase family protein
MKLHLIIPLGGTGSRFVKNNYKIYKSFLPLPDNKIILDKIINNFSSFNCKIIVIAASVENKKFIETRYKKKIKVIIIKKHKGGPLITLQLGLQIINDTIEKCENIFVCYSDINWTWKNYDIQRALKEKIAVFTHKGFHPHLQVNSRSDFCLIKKNKILRMSQKKPFTNNYVNEEVAIGCYFFKKIDYINKFFKQVPLYSKQEYYLLTVINYLAKYFNIKSIPVSSFVHLGTPEQYEDYLSWSNRILKPVSKVETKSHGIMLISGKGERVSALNKLKPFLEYQNFEIYNYIFSKMNIQKKYIITNKKYSFYLKSKKNFNIFKIKKTNSMFETIEKSLIYLKQLKKYFLLSCDCFGEFNYSEFKNLKKNNDLVLFAFKKSYLNSTMKGSHTSLTKDSYRISKILVKSKTYKKNEFGLAGFFWIGNSNIFDYIKDFKKNIVKRKINREIIIDDYFKYLLKNHKIKVRILELHDYVHIGSELEYKEYKYWKNHLC